MLQSHIVFPNNNKHVSNALNFLKRNDIVFVKNALLTEQQTMCPPILSAAKEIALYVANCCWAYFEKIAFSFSERFDWIKDLRILSFLPLKYKSLVSRSSSS